MKHTYTEYDVMRALDAMANGQSERKAALEWGVPRATLQGRVYHHTTYQEAAEHL